MTSLTHGARMNANENTMESNLHIWYMGLQLHCLYFLHERSQKRLDVGH